MSTTALPVSSSAQRRRPVGDGVSDLFRRVFLGEMEARDRHFGPGRPRADSGEIQSVARREPVRVGGHIAVTSAGSPSMGYLNAVPAELTEGNAS